MQKVSKTSLLKMAAQLPVGNPKRKAILARLARMDLDRPGMDLDPIPPERSERAAVSNVLDMLEGDGYKVVDFEKDQDNMFTLVEGPKGLEFKITTFDRDLDDNIISTTVSELEAPRIVGVSAELLSKAGPPLDSKSNQWRDLAWQSAGGLSDMYSKDFFKSGEIVRLKNSPLPLRWEVVRPVNPTTESKYVLMPVDQEVVVPREDLIKVKGSKTPWLTANDIVKLQGDSIGVKFIVIDQADDEGDEYVLKPVMKSIVQNRLMLKRSR